VNSSSDSTKTTHWSNLRDECAFLWTHRDRAVHAPNVRLINLVRNDARLDAYLDALRPATKLVLAGEPGSAPGLLFCHAFLAIEAGDPQAIGLLIGMPEPREVIAALCLARQSAATVAIDRLRGDAAPGSQVLTLAVSGGRRRSLLGALDQALTDSDVGVRARARRTVGQLGLRDLTLHVVSNVTDEDPECRFWSAWSAARMGATEPLDTLADIAWNNLPCADRALDLLLRRLAVPQANAWLREFAKLPDRQRSLIRATGVIGDPLYIPWLIEHMAEPATARLAGEAFSMITGLDLAYRDLDRRPPADFQSGPNDDPADENVALDEDEHLPWPDPARIGAWWAANRARFSPGTAYFLGAPKENADWLEALSDAFQRQRHAAALELAIRQPDKAMFEVRARGRLQRQLIARARGLA
jgi:uncharacterized protein (TIGR02270 family)